MLLFLSYPSPRCLRHKHFLIGLLCCRANKMSHDGFSSRCSTGRGYGWRACGENVAYNLPPRMDETVDDTHRRWMNSSGHRANIMNKGFEVVGYGYYACPKQPGDWAERIYWTGWFMG